MSEPRSPNENDARPDIQPRRCIEIQPSPIASEKQATRNNVPSNKRRKVSIACHECRIHKTKCDGVHPVCGSCRKKKLPEGACIYSPERGRRGVKNQYVQLLEDKVKELEAAMNKQKQSNTTTSPIINLPPLTSAIPLSQSNQLLPHASLNIPSSPASLQEQSPMSHNTNATSVPQTSEYVLPESPWPPRRNTQPSPLVSHLSRDSIMEGAHDNVSDQQSGIDAMGAVTSETSEKHTLAGGNDNHQQGYFGSSSAGRFMKQIHDVIDKKKPTSKPAHHSLFGSANSTSSHRGQNRLSSDFLSDIVLPPRKVADGLLESYWRYVHTLYPFLHKPSFMKTYAHLWGDTQIDNEAFDLYESENEPLFQCTLNLVFALGCQLSPDTNENEREVASDLFFQRSKKLLHFDLLESGNIKVVQALLLMGQYLQCTKLPGRCWIVVGLAIRVAQGLGLHLEKKYSNKCYNQLERELRRRLWGGCIVLDRVISMAYGRPFMIPIARDLKLPQAIDDEILRAFPNSPAMQPENKPSYMSFLVHTIELYEIMGEILVTLYSEADAFGGSLDTSARSEIDEQNLVTSLNSILKLERALDNWKHHLPPFLRNNHSYSNIYNLVNDEKEASILLRQSNVLKARYLHICILLYRPLLVFYFTLEESNQQETVNPNITDLQKSLFIQSSQKCVFVAQDLIKTISNNIKAQLPAWWYSVFYLYTAATVLLMARLFPKVRDVVGEESLLQSWNDCLSSMSQYQDHESARNCYRYFSELDKHVWAARNDKQHNNNNNNNNQTMMSSIQILGTLPQSNHIPQQQHDTPYFNSPRGEEEVNNLYNNMRTSDWELEMMQDMSWLGRLPVYTDIESEYQSMNNNTWGNFPFL